MKFVREAQRRALTEPVEVIAAGSDGVLHAACWDVSESGAFLRLGDTIIPGETLVVRFQGPRVRGDAQVVEVVWRRGPSEARPGRPAGVGVRFLSIAPDLRDALRSWVATEHDADQSMRQSTSPRPISFPPAAAQLHSTGDDALAPAEPSADTTASAPAQRPRSGLHRPRRFFAGAMAVSVAVVFGLATFAGARAWGHRLEGGPVTALNEAPLGDAHARAEHLERTHEHEDRVTNEHLVLSAPVASQAERSATSVLAASPPATDEGAATPDRSTASALELELLSPARIQRAFALQAPSRIVVDLEEGARVSPPAMSAHGPGVRAVRVGHPQGGVTRIVVDLVAPTAVASVAASTKGKRLHVRWSSDRSEAVASHNRAPRTAP